MEKVDDLINQDTHIHTEQIDCTILTRNLLPTYTAAGKINVHNVRTHTQTHTDSKCTRARTHRHTQTHTDTHTHTHTHTDTHTHTHTDTHTHTHTHRHTHTHTHTQTHTDTHRQANAHDKQMHAHIRTNKALQTQIQLQPSLRQFPLPPIHSQTHDTHAPHHVTHLTLRDTASKPVGSNRKQDTI